MIFQPDCFWDGLQPPTSNLFLVVSGSRSFLHLPPASQVPDLKAHLQIRGLSEVGPGRNLGQWGIDTYLSLLTWADTDRNDMFFTARKKWIWEWYVIFKIIGYSTLALWRRPKGMGSASPSTTSRKPQATHPWTPGHLFQENQSFHETGVVASRPPTQSLTMMIKVCGRLPVAMFQ